MVPPFFPKLRKYVHTACLWYCAIIFVLMLGVVLFQVFLRNILGIPMPWAEEASIYMMVSLGLFGSAFVMIEKGLLFVDMIINKFPKKLRQLTLTLTLLLQVLFVSLIVYFSIGSMEYAGDVQAISLGISMQLPYLSIPIAFSLMLFELLLQFAESIYVLFSHEEGEIL